MGRTGKNTRHIWRVGLVAVCLGVGAALTGGVERVQGQGPPTTLPAQAQPGIKVIPLWEKQFVGRMGPGLVQLSENGERIVVAESQSTETETKAIVHYLDGQGRTLWQSKGGIPDISGVGENVAIYSSDGKIRYLNHKGEVLWTVKSIGTPALSHNGKLLGALGDELNTLAFVEVYDKDGKKLRTIDVPTTKAAIEGDRHLEHFAVTDGKRVWLFAQNGGLLWTKVLEVPEDLGVVNPRVTISSKAESVVVITNGLVPVKGKPSEDFAAVFSFDLSGKLLWKKAVDVQTDVFLSGDGTWVLIIESLTQEKSTASLVDTSTGQLQWKREFTGAFFLPGAGQGALSKKGSLIVLGSGLPGTGGRLFVLKSDGTILFEQSFNDGTSVLLSKNGHRLAVVTRHLLRYFKIEGVEAEEEEE